MRLFCALLILLILALPTPSLAVTRTLLMPGDATMAITVLWQPSTAELRVPPGWSIEDVTGQTGIVPLAKRWRVTAPADAAPGPYDLVLLVNGAEVDRITVDVCCIVAKAPLRMVWLPVVWG